MGNWKHFRDEEVVGLNEDLVSKLDRAREFFGFPIIITSGYRSKDRNVSAGGVSNSSHLAGLAVDLECHDTELQKRLVWALCVAGFVRIGAYSKHIHTDIDLSKPYPAYWSGDYKN